MDSYLCVWLIVSTLICIWDATFVLFRPHSLPLGDLEYFWLPYSLYIKIDTRYGDMTDDFVVAQSWANLMECCLNIISVILLWRNSKSGVLLGYIVTLFTFWKTVIYFLCSMSWVTGHDAFSHVPMEQFILLFLVPNGVWIVVPFIFILCYSRKLYTMIKKVKKQ